LEDGSGNHSPKQEQETGSRKQDRPAKTERVQAAKRAAAQLPGFDRFYDAYPKHEARADAEKAWKALAPDEALLATMLAAIGAQGLARKERQFVPLPASWLRGKRWADEVPSSAAGAPAPAGYEDMASRLAADAARETTGAPAALKELRVAKARAVLEEVTHAGK